MTMLHRLAPKAPPQFALTNIEMDLLDALKKGKTHSKKQRLSDYLLKIAKLGGYLARTSDPPPGNTVIWRGFVRLIDIEFGFHMAMGLMGN
jgi:hypothetical protein